MFLLLDVCVSPKAAAEELGYTFLPCVLSNLNRAPSLISLDNDCNEDTRNKNKIGYNRYTKNILTADDVDAVVVPVS